MYLLAYTDVYNIKSVLLDKLSEQILHNKCVLLFTGRFDAHRFLKSLIYDINLNSKVYAVRMT